MQKNIDFKISLVELPQLSGVNLILGQTHFIKSVEDIYESLISSSTTIKFGVAFNEASGDRLIRYDGNEDGLIAASVKMMKDIGCGHCFIVLLKNIYPISVLNRLKSLDEVVSIYAATSNPLKVIIYDDGEDGRGILGVIDGKKPLGIEGDADKIKRHKFLRDIGYKR